jgi:predicted nucleic acid-binding protein
MVVFDASILILLFDPDARPPADRETGQPIARCKERLEHLIAGFERAQTKVIIPTPVLSEVLIRAGEAGPAYLDELSGSAHFKIVPFDTRAAVELAELTREALDAGDKRNGSAAPWAKVKFDRQIVAIARTEHAEVIYSDDDDIRRYAPRLGITVLGIAELPLPPDDSQGNLPLDGKADE